MTLSKQLINLLGILVAVIVLVAGGALIAFPMYSQALAIGANATNVAQSNAVYQAQIDGLSAANERIDEIDVDLAELRKEIAAQPQLDDAYEIIAAAAQRADVRIESVTASEMEAWLPRAGHDENGNAVEQSTEPAAGSGDSADAAGDGSDATAAESTPKRAAPSADSPQRQIMLTVVIDVAQPYALAVPGAEAPAVDADAEAAPDAASVRAAATERARKASAFVDDLGGGPRLLAPVNIEYASGKLTLSVLTFIRTES